MTEAHKAGLLVAIEALKRTKPPGWKRAVHQLCNELYAAEHKAPGGDVAAAFRLPVRDAFRQHLERMPRHDDYGENSWP